MDVYGVLCVFSMGCYGCLCMFVFYGFLWVALVGLGWLWVGPASAQPGPSLGPA